MNHITKLFDRIVIETTICFLFSLEITIYVFVFWFIFPFRWIYTINRAEARELVKSSATVTVQKEYNLKPAVLNGLQNDGNLSVISELKTL